MPIADNATIADVTMRLNKPEAFVRSVLENMHECRRVHGDALVRIGVTGEGRAPNYRIEYPDGEKVIGYAAYNGLSHKEVEDLGEQVITFPPDFVRNPNLGPGEIDIDFLMAAQVSGRPHDSVNEHWSARSMSLAEIAALLGRLRRRRG